MIVTMRFHTGEDALSLTGKRDAVVLELVAERDGQDLSTCRTISAATLRESKVPSAVANREWAGLWFDLCHAGLGDDLDPVQFLVPGDFLIPRPASSGFSVSTAPLEAFLAGETVDVKCLGTWTPGFVVLETRTVDGPEIRHMVTVSKAGSPPREVNAEWVRRSKP